MNMSNYSDLMEELRTEYLESFDEKFKIIREYFKSHDWYNLELEYHKLKGTGSTYGVPEVTTLCQKMESLCKKKPHNLENLIDQSIFVLSKIKDKYLDNVQFEMESTPEFISIDNQDSGK
ncbi:MAG: Hpt domain-containing protein [Bdellovibrionales bacterium]|nr:Hpt domain-containing protein [Bdellovibrionales bacterium]